MYIARTLSKTLRAASASFPVVLVTGPRQMGKTTLKLTEEAVSAKGVKVQRETIADMAAILGYGTMSTPGSSTARWCMREACRIVR